MKRYVFHSIEGAKKFVLEVIAVENIWDFNYRRNIIEFLDEIPNEIKVKIKEYGGKEDTA